MKKFIIQTGKGLIEVSAWLFILIIIIAGFAALLNDFLTGIATWLIGFILFVFIYYSIFLIIDIDDNLTEINKKLEYPEINISDNKPQIKNIGLNGKEYKDD